MSGIYIHIPYCRKACHYCNFHFSTNLEHKNSLVKAICKDIILNSNYLTDKKLQTIYFGGGTPSLLTEHELGEILDILSKQFHWENNIEFTFECNPDDVQKEYIKSLRRSGVNRLSIGVQSFFEEDLQFMNRSHNAYQAEKSIKLAQDNDISNISIDLIYGSPSTSDHMWQVNISKALSYKISHISSYCLTIEEKTVFDHKIKNGLMKEIDDEQSSEQFLFLMDALEKEGFDHYEISNFALPGHYAIHNTNYWKGSAYLGIGPSAHSYNGKCRRWNVSHNSHYINALQTGDKFYEEEILSDDNKYNEYVMTSLRTMWGIDLNYIENYFGAKYLIHCLGILREEKEKLNLKNEGNIVKLTNAGKLYADRIASEFFV